MPFSGLMWILPKKASVNLSKQNIWSNAMRCNNIPLSSTGMDTKHVYQFNVKFYQNPSRDYTYSIFLLLKNQRHRFAIHECHQSEEMEKPWHSCYEYVLDVFFSWNAAHGLCPWSDAYNSAFSESHGNSGFLTQRFPLTNTMNTSKWIPAAADFSNSDSN